MQKPWIHERLDFFFKKFFLLFYFFFRYKNLLILMLFHVKECERSFLTKKFLVFDFENEAVNHLWKSGKVCWNTQKGTKLFKFVFLWIKLTQVCDFNLSYLMFVIKGRDSWNPTVYATVSNDIFCTKYFSMLHCFFFSDTQRSERVG